MGKGYHSFADVMACDFIQCRDNTLPEGFGWFAILDSIPITARAGYTHDIDLPFL